MTDTPSIPPALRAEEWRTWREEGHVTRDGAMILHTKGRGSAGVPRISCLRHPMDVEAHAAAAVLLDGQSFGFTQDDVTLLFGVAHHFQAATGDRDYSDRIAALALRISALLPPR